MWSNILKKEVGAMNYKKLFVIVSSVLTIASSIDAVVAPYYSIRSQGAYESRYQAGLYPFLIDRRDSPKPFGVFSVTTDYSRSFNSRAIANSLFGDNRCGNNQFGARCADGQQGDITISGSRVANRGPRDWLADYFYLPNDFKSTLSFEPIVDTFLVDFSFLIDLNEWAHGTYFSFHAPVAQTRFDIRMCESVHQRGVNPQPAGMFAPGEVNRGQLLEDFTSYAQGDLVQPITQNFQVARGVPTVPGVGTNKPFLTIFQQLKKAQISPCRLKETGIADIRMAFGWNWIRDTYHAGFNVQAVAPAGNRPQGIYLFEPIVGNGHHWEFGANFNAHYDVWTNYDETKKCAFYVNANVTHLFTNNQFRTLDLVNSYFSRYMLMEKLDTPVTNNLLGDNVKPTLQFKQEFAPVANLSNIRVAVSSAVQADILLTSHMEWYNCSLDVGYNLWIRSPDIIKAIGPNEFDGNKSWALKGDAQVFGYAQEDNLDPKYPLVAGQPVALSATQNNATIYSGTNFPATGAVSDAVYRTARQNLNINGPKHATAGGSELLGLGISSNGVSGSVGSQDATSINGVADSVVMSGLASLVNGIAPIGVGANVVAVNGSATFNNIMPGIIPAQASSPGAFEFSAALPAELASAQALFNNGTQGGVVSFATTAVNPGSPVVAIDSLITVNGDAVINNGASGTTLVTNAPTEVAVVGSTPLVVDRDNLEPLQINTSIQPKILSLDDLNVCSGRTRGMTSSVFAHVHYNGNELRGFTPSIGVGGQAEFAHGSSGSSCGSINTALSQWQLWLKICFAFN